MDYRTIGQTGLKVSALSFGASSLGGVFHSISESEAIRAAHVAVEGGMNFIDVSPYYGHYKAETVLGNAVTDLTQITPELGWRRMNRYGRGVWAGSIRYHNNRFYVFFGTPDEGYFVTSAPSL